MAEPGSDVIAEGLYGQAKTSRFQFKSADTTERHGIKRRRAEKSDEVDAGHGKLVSRRRHKHRHRSAHEDRHLTSTRDGAYYDPDHRHRESLYDDIVEKDDGDPGTAGFLPDEAFRESLFDALADDEGAAYWEGVYGQPVHIYPTMKPGPDGKLEQMSEEEYADYVRTKMWEKSHQHIVQEREAKEKARKQQRKHLVEDMQEQEAERETIRQRMAESLRRGEERKRAKEAEAAWDTYATKWAKLNSAQLIPKETHINVRSLIPWPVVSGQAIHVAQNEIEHFLRASSAWGDDEGALLKAERVRWHPDKMQQRFGQHIDADTMKLVTAVFQVVDRLWNDLR